MVARRLYFGFSDTGQLIWDLSDRGRGVVTVNTGKSKAVIGYGGNKRFDLGGVVLEPSKTLQNGWCAITLTAMEGELSSGSSRLLLTATGYVENTNMGWKSPEKSTVGRDWGTAPSLVEGIPARITLPSSSEQVQAWALDGCGQRKAPIPIERNANGDVVIVIGRGGRGGRSNEVWLRIPARPILDYFRLDRQGLGEIYAKIGEIRRGTDELKEKILDGRVTRRRRKL